MNLSLRFHGSCSFLIWYFYRFCNSLPKQQRSGTQISVYHPNAWVGISRQTNPFTVGVSYFYVPIQFHEIPEEIWSYLKHCTMYWFTPCWCNYLLHKLLGHQHVELLSSAWNPMKLFFLSLISFFHLFVSSCYQYL